MKCHVCGDEIDLSSAESHTEAVVDHFEEEHWE
jgi:hypothetical protein